MSGENSVQCEPAEAEECPEKKIKNMLSNRGIPLSKLQVYQLIALILS